MIATSSCNWWLTYNFVSEHKNTKSRCWIIFWKFYFKLAEAPGTALVNFQPAEQLLFCKQFSKMSTSAFQTPQAQMGEGAGVKLAPKPSLNRWGFVYRISLWSWQGCGFPLVLHIPTDRQTNICMPIFTYIDGLLWDEGIKR